MAYDVSATPYPQSGPSVRPLGELVHVFHLFLGLALLIPVLPASGGTPDRTGVPSLEIELDNVHSMLRSKTVTYRVHKVGDPENRCDGLPNLFGLSPEDDPAPKKKKAAKK